MNSSKLSENHFSVYQKFYMKQTTVCSLPFLSNWTDDGTGKKVYIKQKLPLRLHIGVSTINQGKIELGSITYYDHSEGVFNSSEFNNFM